MKNCTIAMGLILAMLFVSQPFHSTATPDKPKGKSTKAQRYNVTTYGAVDSKETLSTEAVQKAIDEASAAGGGQVYVPKGYFLIAPIQLKSDVELYLEKGAVLLGATDRTLYNIPASPQDIAKAGERALIWAADAKNISIKGKGKIDGQGEAVAFNTGVLIAQGIIKDRSENAIKKRIEGGATDFLDEGVRPQEENRPMLIALYDSHNVTIDGVTITNSAAWVTTVWRCNNVKLTNLTVNSRSFWNNDGIDIIDCSNTLVENCRVNSADDGICLKSHDAMGCNNITVKNCAIVSSASAIKFGTASHGGFKNIVIDNIKVNDTYRSAIAIEAVDGGRVDNVKVSNITAKNTGNAIFVGIGTRRGNSTMSNISIEKLTCQIPAGKPDTAYTRYVVKTTSRPIRNVLPMLITGAPNTPIKGVKLKDITVTTAAGGKTTVGNKTIDNLVDMDALYGRYPEFDMFGELPAWGLLCRNVEGLELINVNINAEAVDYRHPVILDKIDNITINGLKVKNETKVPVLISGSQIYLIADIKSPSNTSGKDYEVR